MIYIALLRGINVGGNNKIDMKKLKQVFEGAGMTAVKTYINSGNIIFANHEHDEEELPAVLEKAISENFQLHIKVLIRSREEFGKILQAVPENWTNDQSMKSDVLFLWEEADSETVLEQLTIKPGIDRVTYVPGVLLWSVDRDKVSRSGLSKIVGTGLYGLVTVRNVNTVRKIAALMDAIEQ